jgi:hypothetical protein
MVSRAVSRLLHVEARGGSLGAIVGLLFFVSISAADAELDLSPKLELFELEGVKLPQLAFSNGTSHEAIYRPPADWKYSGGKDYLDLLPQNLAQAKAKVAKWLSPFSFDPEGLKQLTQRFVESLPEGSEQVKVQSEELNPLQIDGHQTYLVQITYVYYGEKYACYALLLDRKAGPLSFRLICRAADYDNLREAFQKSLYSWQNL